MEGREGRRRPASPQAPTACRTTRLPRGEQRGPAAHRTPGAQSLQKARVWGNGSRCSRAMLPEAREQWRDALSNPISPLHLDMETSLICMQIFAKNNNKILFKIMTYNRETCLSSVGLYESCTAPFITGNLGVSIPPLGLLHKLLSRAQVLKFTLPRFGVWPLCQGTVSAPANLMRSFSVCTSDFSFPSGTTKCVCSGGSGKTGQRCRQFFCAATAKPTFRQASQGDGFTGEDGESSSEPVSSADGHTMSPVIPSTPQYSPIPREGPV